MEHPRKDPLARATFAANQHHRIGRRDLAPLLQHEPQPRIARVERRFRHVRVDLVAEAGDLVSERLFAIEALEHRTDLGRRERLGKVVERARRIASTAVSMLE